jgi:hypothetical protein
MADFGSSRSIVDRMRGAAALDVATYEEVEADVNATGQAAIVVVLVAIASGIGNYGHGHGTGIIAGIVAALLGWASWATITYFIGTRFFGGTATWGELARTLGFAQSPGILMVLGIVPGLGLIIRLVVGIWMLVAGIIAIRQALDVDTGKAVLVALAGWAVYIVIGILLGGLTSLF